MFEKFCLELKIEQLIFNRVIKRLKENPEAWKEVENLVFSCKIPGPTIVIRLHLLSCDIQMCGRTVNYCIFSKGEEIIRLLQACP
jgi:hypothetical protein